MHERDCSRKFGALLEDESVYPFDFTRIVPTVPHGIWSNQYFVGKHLANRLRLGGSESRVPALGLVLPKLQLVPECLGRIVESRPLTESSNRLILSCRVAASVDTIDRARATRFSAVQIKDDDLRVLAN